MKPIPGFEHYKVDCAGNVYNNSGKVLSDQKQNSGYLLVHLHSGNKRKACTVHRLVASAFLPNPENKPQVNHKNGVKTDNRLENLEWSSLSENMRHAFDTGRMDNAIRSAAERMRKIGHMYGGKHTDHIIASRKPVIQMNMDGTFIREWPSIKHTRKAGFHNVGKVVNGRYSQSGGFKWAYK